MGPAVLSDAISGIKSAHDEHLIVGIETSDDAAVYRLTDELAVISTVDFITPPVDEPWWFGQIAAANSISDVYAMGGRPLTALNVVMFPEHKLDPGVLREILQGGGDKANEAGVAIAGGHTVEDPEPKYGLSVNGIVHPDRIIRNIGAQKGDALVLTKPLGSGVIFNARKAGKLTFTDIEDTLHIVATLNALAATQAMNYTVHACTDITGFGIIGHAYEMASGSGVSMELDYSHLPLYEHAAIMYKKGQGTGSNKANRSLTKGHLRIKASISSYEEELLFDPQTSGGLLLSLPEDEARRLVEALRAGGNAHASIIGRVIEGSPGSIEVI